eukprot:COSAG02_NODE_8736_length_2459_cov_1.735593_3_plen_281_part_00
MRWAALPTDPAVVERHSQRAASRCIAERPFLRTSLAVDEDARQTGAAPDGGSAREVLSRSAVTTERSGGHMAAPDDEIDPIAADKALIDVCKGASHDRWHPGMGPDPRGPRRVSPRCRRDASAPAPGSEYHTRLPKSPSEDVVEQTRRWLLHALLPHCTCSDYIASALHAAERLGPAADELKCLRGSLEKKYARLAMPYVDYTSYLQNTSTGLKVAKPQSRRVKSLWRSASTLAVAKRTSVAELAISAVSTVRSQHGDTLGGIADEASRVQLQHGTKMPP